MVFKKGQSGNPTGRAGEKIWKDAIQLAVHEISESAEDKGMKVKKLRKLANKLVDKALDGDVSALKEIGDRLDGKPHQTHTNELTAKVTLEQLVAASLPKGTNES